MKIQVTRGAETRLVKASRLQEYLSAGWQQSSDKHGEEVIRLKPPAKKSKAAEPIAEEQANDNIQGE